MNLLRKPLAFIIGLLTFFSPVSGQEDNEDQFKYCIAVKQTFESWGECSHDKPQFQKAVLKLKKVGDSVVSEETITSDKVGETIAFSETFVGSSEFSKGALNLKYDEIDIEKIVINTEASDIRNDTKLSYETSSLNWRVGVNEPVSEIASDPCSNNANWSGNREGYTMFTSVIIDDPVMIAKMPQENFNAEEDYLVLEFNEFYLSNEHEDIVLQMKLNAVGYEWEDLKAFRVLPGKKAYISYSQIAGKKSDPNSNYYNWLDTPIDFRVKKVLLNGSVTYGNSEAAAFNTSGPQFRVKEVRRSWCQEEPVIEVEFLDQKEIAAFDEAAIKWELRGPGGLPVPCVGKKISGTTYQIDPKPTDPISPFINEDTWTIQLKINGRTDLDFPEVTFTIPKKLEEADVQQSAELYPSVDPKYHFMSTEGSPYAIINITDPGNRLPYSIYKMKDGKRVYVDELDSRPSNFSALSVDEQEAIYQDFVNTYRYTEKERRNTNWEKYFHLRFNDWFFESLQPTRTTISNTTGELNCNSSFTNDYLFVMSDNANFIATTSYYNITNASPIGVMELSYDNQQISDDYHTFWRRNARSNVFSFIGSTASEGHNSVAPGTWLKIDNRGNCLGKSGATSYSPRTTNSQGNYQLVNYNGCSFVGKDLSDNFFLVITLGAARGNAEALPEYYDGIIDATGTKCTYRNEDGSKLFYYERGVSHIRSWTGTQITNIRYINTTAFPNYIIYETASGDRYQQYMLDESNKQEVSDRFFRTESLYIGWYNDYLEEQWQQYLANNYGHRLYNHTVVNPASDETYFLIDKDGCEVEFPVNVKMPPQPDFVTVSSFPPSMSCSSDGEITLRCTTEGLLPLSYVSGSNESGTIESVDQEVTFSSLSWAETISFYNTSLGFTYEYVVSFTNPARGIQSVVKQNNTCGESNGKIEIIFASNSTSEKIYRITDENNAISEFKTTENAYTFEDLEGNKAFTVSVSADGCSIPWGKSLQINNQIFTITAEESNATVIGGDGSAVIEITNLPANVSWTGPVYAEGQNTVIFPLGEHVISATHDGCLTSDTISILEPGFTADLSIVKKENDFVVSTSNFVPNDQVVISSFTIEDQQGNIYEENTEIPASNSYIIVFNYDGYRSNIYDFSETTFADMSTAHIGELEEQQCPGDEVRVTIVPENTESGFKVNFEGVFLDELEISTSQSALRYTVQTSESEIFEMTSSQLKVNKVLQADAVVDIPQAQPVFANVRFSGISCNGSNDGKISISNARGGSGNYVWRLSNSDTWLNAVQVAGYLFPGTHTVYLKDSGNNCQEVNVGSVTLEEPEELVVADSDLFDPVCAHGTGWVSMTVEGGNGRYRYVLDKDEAIEDFYPLEDFTDELSVTFEDLGPGAYILTATDPMGCEVDEDFVLEQYDNPRANQINVDPVVCHDQSNGAIEIVETSGTGQLEILYLLDMNKVELDTLAFPDHKFDGLSAGTYRLLLQDVNGCLSDTVQKVVPQPLPLQLTVESVDHVVAKGESSGRIRAKVDGGNNTQLMTAKVSRLGLESNELVWDGSLIEGRLERFNKLMAGIYEIEVKDYKDCLVVSDAIEVLEPEEALGIETLEIIDALCKARIGSFSIQGTGGWGSYSYKMATDGGYTSISTFEELSAGSYEVMVEDSLGAKVSSFITINEPDLLMTQVVDQTLPTCDNNGVLEVEISGGSWPYQMSYDYEADPLEVAFPQIVALDNLSAGDFSLTTIDANGCRSEVRQSLSAANLLSIIDFDRDYPSAPGSENGRLKAVVEGGNAPFEFEWKSLPAPEAELAFEGAELSNVGAGYYEVTVSEAGGCSQSDRFYLPAVTDGFLTINELGHETAFAASDGFASLSAGQSILTSVEVFYPGDRFETLTGDSPSIIEGTVLLNDLPGGKYLVRATGPAGMEVAEFEIETYKAFAFGVVSVSDVRERGLSDGSVSVAVVGGAPDFVFEWEAVDGDLSVASYSSTANIGIAEGLSAGSYSVRVTDRYGNEINRIVEVQQPSATLELEVADTRNQSCNSYEDAWVQVSATGGWGDYQFRHADADEFENPRRWNNLPVGEHKFFTIDQKGIVDSVSITITEPLLLRANVALIDSVDCFGEANGQIYFEVTGGTAPYRFALLEKDLFWLDRTAKLTTDEGERTFYLDRDLAEGQFVYRFADANNCLAADTLSVYVPQPDELLFSLTEVVHTTCNTDNGSIEVALQGGTLPYRYEWTDDSGSVFSTDASVNQLKQNGFYQLKVWDKHNCQQQFEQNILPSTLPVITSIATEAVLCYGDSNGMASVAGVTPAEPYAPYDFRWSNSLVGDTATGFLAGRHSVTVHDANGCETTKYFDIATPDTLGLSVVQLRDAHCYGYNDGQIEVRPFGGVGSYRMLWSNGDTVSVAKNLAKGTYQLAFTDLNNCLFEQSFVINEPPMEVVDLGDDFTMCPGNNIVIDGRNFAAHEWRREETLLSAERYLTVAAEGEYVLRVTNDRGCFAYDTIAVSIGNDALKADFLMSSDAILGDTILIFELSNLPLDSLSWVYPPEVFSNETPLETDDYILHLKTLDHGMYNVALYAYSGGCFSQQVKQVEVRAESDLVDEDDFLGYQDPLIKHFVVTPNPNDGRFNVNVELRESADIHLAVFSVSQGVKLEERRSSGMDAYAESFVLANVNTGVYVVVLSAGSERRQIKIVID